MAQITVSPQVRLIQAFEQQIASAFLRRDRFLDRVLEVELPRIGEALGEERNTDEARREISGAVAAIERSALVLKLSDANATHLDALCQAHNLVRDALFNRLLFSLVISPKSVSEMLRLPDPSDYRVMSSSHSDIDYGRAQLQINSGIKAAANFLDDPLQGLYRHFEDLEEFQHLDRVVPTSSRLRAGVWTWGPPSTISGRGLLDDFEKSFVLVLGDEYVPGTAAFDKRMKLGRRLLDAFLAGDHANPSASDAKHGGRRSSGRRGEK